MCGCACREGRKEERYFLFVECVREKGDGRREVGAEMEGLAG